MAIEINTAFNNRKKKAKFVRYLSHKIIVSANAFVLSPKNIFFKFDSIYFIQIVNHFLV